MPNGKHLALIVCLLSAATSSYANETPTWAEQIAPILHRECADCHRPEGAAPFSLLTFDDARKRARQIAEVVQDRLMPPWRAEPGHGSFLGERRLGDREILLIHKWATTGAPAGDAAKAPPPPQFSSDWQLGPPDLVLEVPEEFTIPAEGDDITRCFVIPIPVTEDRFITGVEFRPGNRRVVRHAELHLDRTGMARAMDAQDEGIGYASFSTPGFPPAGSLGAWSPGMKPRRLPPGVGRHIAPGTDLVIQVHYHPTGKPERDRSSVAVYFAKEPVGKRVGSIGVENWDFNIPPGESAHRVRASYTLPVATTLLSGAPHMHFLGSRMTVRAVLPGGLVRPLLSVGRWDHSWPGVYIFREPIPLPSGTRIELEAIYDNTTDNPRQPSEPPVYVRHGATRFTEMALCKFEVICETEADLQNLIADDARHRRLTERALKMKH